MLKHTIPCLLLGLVGLGFLGAGPREIVVLESPEPGVKPQPIKNVPPSKSPTVINVGYIIVTTPSGEYITDRREVVSLSAHSYEIDGGMRVWEVTLSERSANTVRWYFTKALPVIPVNGGSPNEEGEGGKLDTLNNKSNSSDPPAQTKDKESSLLVPVRKTYPATTHAHTIEYRAESLKQLDDLYAYLCLMVYGWSPKMERPPEARRNYPFSFDKPSWLDWDNEEDH